MGKKHYTGFAVALAWPQTFCKQAGAWYDNFLNLIGIAKNNYYRVGHAAVLLVDAVEGKSHYFDFGRYHAPVAHGRVRSVETDHDLVIRTLPIISKDMSTLENLDEVLIELQSREAFHGEGNLYASYTKINFEKSYRKAVEMEMESPISYGPFLPNGSNCSRFVNTVITAGNPPAWHWFKLKYYNPLTPTPLQNVYSLPHKTIKEKQYKEIKFSPLKLNDLALKSTLQAPPKNEKIPHNALWLSGEGAGSWFVLHNTDSLLKVDRYSPAGVLECSGFFKSEINEKLPLTNDVQIMYPSTCKSVKLRVNNKEVRYNRVSEN